MELLNCASESKPSLQNLSSRGNHLLTFWLPSFSLSARTHTWQIVTYNLLSKSEYRRSQLLVVFFFFPAIKSTYATLGGLKPLKFWPATTNYQKSQGLSPSKGHKFCYQCQEL